MADYYAERIRTKARYDIPAPLAREIGRFLVTWAHFEHYVQAIIWTALKLGEEEGRLTVREPRVTERIDMIRELGEFQNLAMDYVLLQEIRKRADPLAGKRHLLEDLKKVGDQHRPVPLPEKRKPRSVPKGQKPDRSGSKHKPPRPT
jgi:hypothetical protein